MLEASGISIHMQSVAQASRQQLSEAIQQAIQALQIFVSWKGCRVYSIQPCCQRGRAFPCWIERAESLAGGRQHEKTVIPGLVSREFCRAHSLARASTATRQ